MGRTSRTVARLHLRAASRSAVRRALPLIEDAFRTATLPDAGARLVFVRRLNLGRLPEGASAQTLSLLLESRFTQADWRLVPARDADEHDARAVWFRDALEAHELAALRIAGGRPLNEWFWPLAVPALATAASPADRIRVIAFSLAAQEEAAAALPAWVTALVRAGHREQLIAALRPGDGRALLHAAGVRYVTPAPQGHSDSDTMPGSVSGAQAQDRPRSPRTPRPLESSSAEYEESVELVEQMLRLTQKPSRSHSTLARTVERNTIAPGSVAAAPRLRMPIRGVAPGGVLDPKRSSDSPRTHVPDTDPTPEKDPSAGSRRERPGPADESRASLPIRGARASETSGPHDTRSNTEAIEPASSAWALPAAAPTAAGGLLFLLPVLERLGFAEWCRTRPAGDAPPATVVRQIFHLLLTRLRIAEDDPAWELAVNLRLTPEATNDALNLRLNAEATSHAIRGFRLPPSPRLRRTAGALAEAGQAEETIARGWLTACRRLLRRRARIGLATLVVRPARLAVTDTHVDVFFRLSAADLRIRRAGLDIDPGWIPWFASVVTFHYQDWP